MVGALVTGSVVTVLAPSPAQAVLPAPVHLIAAGDFFSLAVTNDGTLWSFGENSAGQLGTTTNSDTFTPNPTPTPVLSGVAQVAAGHAHSLALKGDGTVWAFGDSTSGRLAFPKDPPFDTPTPTKVLGGVSQIAAGGAHSLALEPNGTLWSFGLNRSGQLGTATNSDTFTPNPTPTPVLTDVVQMAAGGSHSLALKRDGTLWSFGDNSDGQLGTTTNLGTSNANPTPTQVLTDVAQIAAGEFHSLVLKRDGTLWSFGYNLYGQLGTATNAGSSSANPTPTQVLTDVVQIAAGGNHSLAVKSDGTLWTFGLNSAGQLGTADPVLPHPTPTQVLTGVTQVSAGSVHSLAVRSDGSLWSFGGNLYGQIGRTDGVGTTGANPTPTQVLTGVGTPAGTSTEFDGLPPARLWDSRPGAATVDAQFAGTGAIAGGTEIALDVAGRGGVPASAAAVVLNVTATEAQDAGFVTVWPCGRPRPLASNLNYEAGQTVPNLVVAQIGDGGTVCFFSRSTTHLVVDVTGSFPTTSSFAGLVPARLMDTRAGATTIDGQHAGTGLPADGAITTLPVTGRGGVPATASAVVLNITVTEPRTPGYITVFPCGQPRPLASNLNYVAGTTIANLTIAKTGTDGAICLYNSTATHLVVDVTGSFPATSSFAGLVPARLMDTRPGATTIDNQHAGTGLPADGAITTLPVTGRGGVPATAAAVVLNITVTEPRTAGYVTVYPCGQPRPLASNLNYVAGTTIANLTIAKTGTDGTVCLYDSTATHLVVDVTGSFPA